MTTTTATETTETTTTETTTETPPGQPESLQFGETYTGENRAVTVERIEFEARDNPGPMGDTFAHIQITVENLDDTRTAFPTPMSFQLAVDGQMHEDNIGGFARLPLAINETTTREIVYVVEAPEVGDPVWMDYAGQAVWKTTVEELPTTTDEPVSPDPSPVTTVGAVSPDPATVTNATPANATAD